MKRIILLIVSVVFAVLVLVAVTKAVTDSKINPNSQAKCTPINTTIESWYKTLQGEQHIGYNHEKISPKGRPEDGYEYFAEGDMVLGNINISVTFNASLDKNFFPLSFIINLIAANREATFSLHQAGNAKSLEMVTNDGIRKNWTIDSKEEFYPSIEIALYALKQKGLLEKKEPFNVKIFTSDITYILDTVELEVINTNEKRKYLDKDINVTAVKLSKAKTGVETFYLDNYGRMLEEVAYNVNLKNIIVNDSNEAKGGVFSISQKGRRDPFQPALTPKGKGTVSPLPLPTITKPTPTEDGKLPITPDNIKQYLNEVNNHLNDMKKFKKEGKEADLKVTYENLIKVYQVLSEKITNPIDRDNLNKLRYEAEELYPGASMAFQDAKHIYDNIELLFQNDKWQELSALHPKLQSIALGPSLFGTEYKSKVYELISKSARLIERSINKSELLAKKLKVSGIFYYIEDKPVDINLGLSIFGQSINLKETVFLSVPNSYTIVNGKAVREGDIIEGVSVKKINKKDVVFSYKGEELPVLIKF